MTRLLSIALLAATLSAQQSSSFVDRYDTRSDSTVRLNPGVYIVDPPSMVSTESWPGSRLQLVNSPATKFDGNGALEAFYVKPHHSKRSWMRASIRKSFRAVTGHGALHNAGSNRPVGPLAQSTPGAKR